jgi:hypothetical protein
MPPSVRLDSKVATEKSRLHALSLLVDQVAQGARDDDGVIYAPVLHVRLADEYYPSLPLGLKELLHRSRLKQGLMKLKVGSSVNSR